METTFKRHPGSMSIFAGTSLIVPWNVSRLPMELVSESTAFKKTACFTPVETEDSTGAGRFFRATATDDPMAATWPFNGQYRAICPGCRQRKQPPRRQRSSRSWSVSFEGTKLGVLRQYLCPWLRTLVEDASILMAREQGLVGNCDRIEELGGTHRRVYLVHEKPPHFVSSV